MSGAIFSLALGLAGFGAAPVEREYSGAEAAVVHDVPGPATSPPAAPPTGETPAETPPPSPESAETLPVPPPVVAPPTTGSPAPGPAPAPAPAPAVTPPAAKPDAKKPTPKWWGPFPRPKITGFGGPAIHLTGLDRKFAAFVGLGGGVTFIQRISLGAMVMWLLNPSDAGTTALGARRRLNMNYGGVLLDVVLVRKGRVDLSLAGLIGGGGACLQNPEKGNCYDRTSFFLGQPSLAAHVKLLPVVRLVFEMGYRFVLAKGWTGPANGRLGAPVGTFMIEIGWF